MRVKYGLVFPSPRAGKLRDNIRKSLLTAVKKANVVRNDKRLRVTLHTLRKCYATWGAMEERMPHRQLQDQLGHAPGSKMTLKHYVGRSRDLLQECVMPSLSCLKMGKWQQKWQHASHGRLPANPGTA